MGAPRAKRRGSARVCEREHDFFATIFVGFGADWRVTMQEYAAENTNFVRRLPWDEWSAVLAGQLGVIQTKYLLCRTPLPFRLFNTQLMGNHFADNGTVYINLDSFWNNNFTRRNCRVLLFIAMLTDRKRGSIGGRLSFLDL